VVSHVSYSDIWETHHGLSIRLEVFLLLFPPPSVSFPRSTDVSKQPSFSLFVFLQSIRRAGYTFYKTPLIGSSVNHYSNPHKSTFEPQFPSRSKNEVDLPQRHLGPGALGLGLSRTARELFLRKQRRTPINTPSYPQRRALWWRVV
jgi:hypothetical protein